GLGAEPLRRAIDELAVRAVGKPGLRIAYATGESGHVADAGDPRRRLIEQRANGLTDGPDGLTAREREVLILLAAGRSDGDIAQALFITKKTASSHVAHIKDKLE